MIVVKPSIEFIWMTEHPLPTIERAARTCYKSEARITQDSAVYLAEKLLRSGHEAMFEHASASYRIICDRGVSHEIVRHRLFSFAQESTRYCDYKELQMIAPDSIYDNQECVDVWTDIALKAEKTYKTLRSHGIPPQDARAVLPTCLKTEIVVTGNFRQWRHFLKLRSAASSHPQIQYISKLLLANLRSRVPVLFDDI